MHSRKLIPADDYPDEFLSEITEAGDLQDTGLRRLNHMESKFEEWLQNWDAHHRGCMTLGLEIGERCTKPK